ncbi:MAG: hypothetical protein Q8L99_09530 [Polycyclovorans sp.]|nr:hypothetical protein [Polycyclovorans sp.]
MTHDATPLSQQYWYQTTSMDLRSLALFRVALAIALGCTLASLMGAVPLWFSDGGMMPRTDSLDLGGLAAHNLTLVTGDTALLRLMLGVGLMASFTLMLGYRTRFSLGVATLVLFSFVTRQPLISLPHEVWLVGLALWSLSLPLGLRWSLDATLGQTLAPGASDTRRGGLIGLSWALQWLALAGAALTIPVQDTAASLAIAGAIALLLALVSRGLLPTPSPWRWATPMLALGGALGVLIAHRSSTALMTVAALAVIPWLPSALWTSLARRHATGKPVQVFYDQDCRFCHQCCRVLQDLLILPPGSSVKPAQDNPRAHALMKAQNSWVVIDEQGRATLHWLAGVTLVRHSAWLAPLAPLLALTPIRAAGDACYQQVVRHRGLLAGLLGSLPPASKPHNTMNGLALMALMLLVAQGIYVVTAPGPWFATPPGLAFTPFIAPPEATRARARQQGQWVAAVERVPGQYRDALRGDQALTYNLTPVTGAYADTRWQRYLAAAGAQLPGASIRRLANRLCGAREDPPLAVNLEWIVAADTRTQRGRIERYRCVDGVARSQRQRLDGDPVDLRPGE